MSSQGGDSFTFYARKSEVIMGVFFLTFSVIGILGNVLTILVLRKAKRLKNACTPYLISVASCDLFMTAVLLPVIGVNAIRGRVIFPRIICLPLSISFHLVLVISWLELAMVGVVRCLAIWTNKKCFLLNWSKSLIALTVLTPVCAISTYFVYYSWGSEEHIRTGYICWFFCGVKEMFDEHADQFSSQIVFWMSSFFTLGPLFLMALSYSLIWLKIHLSNQNLHDNGVVAFNRHQNEVRFARMLGITFGSYITFTVIPAAFIIHRSAKPPSLPGAIGMDEMQSLIGSIGSPVETFIYIAFFTPFFSNPLIYVLTNRQYRHAYKGLFRKIWPKSMVLDTRSQEQRVSDHRELEARFN